MQPPNNKKVSIRSLIGILVTTLTVHPASANSVSGDNSIPYAPVQATTGVATMGNPTQPGIVNSINQVSQQSGIVQVANWGGSSTLSTPSCNGGCVFAVTRISPATYGSGSNMEAMVGVTIPIGTNDSGLGELNRINAEMQKYRTEHEIKLALSEKLAEALENGKTERATIIAMNLAPMMGYKDYQLLLKAVSSSKSTNSPMRTR